MRSSLRYMPVIVNIAVLGSSAVAAPPKLDYLYPAGAQRGAFRVALTGETGGDLVRRVDLLINVPSSDPQRIQEAHITIGHIVCSLIERIRFGPQT